MNNIKSEKNLQEAKQTGETTKGNLIKAYINRKKNMSTILCDDVAGCKIYYQKIVYKDTKKVSVDIFVEGSDGELSETTSLTIERIIKNSNVLDFLLNYSYGFTQEHINTIYKKMMEMVIEKNSEYLEINSCRIEDIYAYVIEYAILNKNNDCVVDDTYVYIETNSFKTFIEDLETDYTPTQVKKEFKKLNLIKVNNGRSYDYTKMGKDGKIHKMIAIEKGWG